MRYSFCNFWNLDVKESNDEFYTNDAEVRPIESLK